ncbi:hypothetical protein CEXT_212081, partial [Caerostris extrusa]
MYSVVTESDIAQKIESEMTPVCSWKWKCAVHEDEQGLI